MTYLQLVIACYFAYAAWNSMQTSVGTKRNPISVTTWKISVYQSRNMHFANDRHHSEKLNKWKKTSFA